MCEGVNEWVISREREREGVICCEKRLNEQTKD